MAFSAQCLLLVIIGLVSYSEAVSTIAPSTLAVNLPAIGQPTPGTGAAPAQTTPVKICIRWDESKDTNTLSGTPDSASSSVDACQRACLQFAGCTGVDWDPNSSGSKCWFSGSWNTGRNNGTAAGVTHYDKVANVPCTESSASTTLPMYLVAALLLLIASMLS